MIEHFCENSKKVPSQIFECVLIAPLYSEKERFLLVPYFPLFHLSTESYTGKLYRKVIPESYTGKFVVAVRVMEIRNMPVWLNG